MISSLEAILLGLIQGVIEFFPISSSGHLIAWQSLSSASTQALSLEHKLFDAVVQVGSGLALLFFFSRAYQRDELPFLRPSPIHLLLSLGIASLPAVLFGILFHSAIKQQLYTPKVVGSALLIGGLFFILAPLYEKKRESLSDPMPALPSWKTLIALGLFQACALIPGVSRSGATIFGGLMLSLPRKEAIYISFLMATPLLIGAGSFDLLKAALSSTHREAIHFMPLIWGALSAFLSSFLLARPLLSFLTRVGLQPFGWYRLIMGLLILWLCR